MDIHCIGCRTGIGIAVEQLIVIVTAEQAAVFIIGVVGFGEFFFHRLPVIFSPDEGSDHYLCNDPALIEFKGHVSIGRASINAIFGFPYPEGNRHGDFIFLNRLASRGKGNQQDENNGD